MLRAGARSSGSRPLPVRTAPARRPSWATWLPLDRAASGSSLPLSTGLKRGVAAVLPGASVQQRRTRFMRNLAAKVARPAQPVFATFVRSIFARDDAHTLGGLGPYRWTGRSVSATS